VPSAQAAGPGAQKTLRAAERDRAELARGRAAWRAELAEVDPRRLVFLDESGIDTRLTRTHARAPKGKRAPGAVPPWSHWRRLTVLGALAREGVVACMSVAAATSTAVFKAFVEQLDRAATKGAGAARSTRRHRRPSAASWSRPFQGPDQAPAGA
jgi:hypothetical protein